MREKKKTTVIETCIVLILLLLQGEAIGIECDVSHSSGSEGKGENMYL